MAPALAAAGAAAAGEGEGGGGARFRLLLCPEDLWNPAVDLVRTRLALSWVEHPVLRAVEHTLLSWFSSSQ